MNEWLNNTIVETKTKLKSNCQPVSDELIASARIHIAYIHEFIEICLEIHLYEQWNDNWKPIRNADIQSPYIRNMDIVYTGSNRRREFLNFIQI